MRIGYVTQWFPPEPGTVVAEAIARGLADLGHEVDVLTGFPNYPTGRVMPGYRVRPYQRDDLSPRIRVHRAPLVPGHDNRAVNRAVNYLSFAAGSSAVARARVPDPDMWLVYSSPATAYLPTLRLRRRRRRPLFLLIQDLWPDSVTGSGFIGGRAGRLADAALTRMCDASYRTAAGIGIISPGMRQVLVERGVPDDKIFDTPNWVDDGHLLPDVLASTVDRHELGLPEGRLWLYAGNLGELQGLGPVIEAFARRPQAQLALLGDGVAAARLKALARDLGAANVTFLPSVPVDRVGRYIAASDVQVVSLQDTPLLRVTMPSKVQTSLAAARPVLAHAAGDAAELVTSTGSGWSARPGGVDNLLAAIDAGLALDAEELVVMGRASRAVFDDRFSAQTGPERLAAALDASRRRALRQR